MAVPLVCLALTACLEAEEIPADGMFSRDDLRLTRDRWGDVIAYTRNFGENRGLRFEGGAERYEGEGLNIALLKGGSWFQGPQISLWLMSEPFEKNKGAFSAITRDTMTPADTSLARDYLAGLAALACSAPYK